MIRTRVVIVGGGLAGLCVAHRLHGAGVHVALLEGRDRLGGRILTVDEAGRPADDGFDLGPSWFWPHAQPAIAELVNELGLPSFAQNSDGDMVFERMSREGPRRYQGVEQEALSFRLVGGSGALVRALAARIPADRLHLRARVVALSLASDGVEVTFERTAASGESHVEAIVTDRVVAAMPPRLLAGSATFTPALDESTLLRWRETPTWMAPHAKFFAVYDRPFWRERGLCGTAQSMVGPMPEMHDATTASGDAALFGFLGVGAEQREALGEQALAQACIAQLVRLFGEEAARPRATLFKDWAADPFTSTAADRTGGAHPVADASPWVSAPWASRLLLAGSETSPSEPGYLAGAVVAARRAAADVLAR